MEELIKERIKTNENLFTEEELKIINSNDILIEKIYLLGILDNIKNLTTF